MISYVYKHKRRVNGKLELARLYRARFRIDGDKKISDVPLYTPDRQVAEKRLAEIIKERQQEAEGVIAPKTMRTAIHTPLEEHFKDYAIDLKTRGCCKKHISISTYRFNHIIQQTGWKLLRDINLDGFYAWRSKQKLSPKTIRAYSI